MKSKTLLSLFILLAIATEALSQPKKCDKKLGCIMRLKYFAHVSFQSKNGEPDPLKSSLNYKIIYVYTDRMVFYSSERSSEIAKELESEKSKVVDESNIERIINFSNIILDCGKFNNRLCIAQKYPDIESVPFFKKIKKIIPTNPDIKCLVIPFFENSYKQSHEKVAFICIHEVRQLQQLINFKNALSRAIEFSQIKYADDRFNSYNGIQRHQSTFVMFKGNKPIQVIGRLFGKSISLVTNNKAAGHVMDFSLYQIRNTGAYFATDAVKKGFIKDDWSKQFEWPVSDDCCLVYPGEKDTLVLCAATNDGKTIESAVDICRVKLKPFLKSTKSLMRSIRLNESSFALISDKAKYSDCKAKEYNIFRQRVEDTLTVNAVQDCELVMNYGEATFESKFRYCFKHYGDEIKLEINLLAHGNAGLYNRFSECFFNDKMFKNMLTANYLKKLLGLKVKKASSFLEVDEIDTDDDAEVVPQKKVVEDQNEIEKLAFTELSSKRNYRRMLGNVKNSANLRAAANNRKSAQTRRKAQPKKSKVKEIEKLMYNQRKTKPDDKKRRKIFRNKQINRILSNHHWTQSKRESMDGKYSRTVASQGNRNADPFVAYLGFLRDSAYKGNVNVLDNEMARYYS